MYLYRGVNRELYEMLSGKLSPRKMNKPFSSVAQYGDIHVQYGSGLQYGNSVINEVIKHQFKQLGISTSGISTTPYFDRALYYALSNGKNNEGYIYKISIEKLGNANVRIIRISDLNIKASVPEDDEHIIIAKDFGCIPSEVIDEILFVNENT
jgi:hypothetical protein